MSRFYITIVQSVLLYGAETQVLNEKYLKILNSFHNKCTRFIAKKYIKKLEDNTWEYLNTEEVLKECDVGKIEDYVKKKEGKVIK